MNVEDRGPDELPLWVNQTADGVWWDVKRLNVTIRVDVSNERVRVRRDRWIGANEDVSFPLQGITAVELGRDEVGQLQIACRVPPMLGVELHPVPVRQDLPYRLHTIVQLLRRLVAEADEDPIDADDEAARQALHDLTRQRTRSG